MTLPQPSDAFDWIQTASGPALVCRPLERIARHFFTARPWLLGSAAGMHTEAAWREVAEAIDTPSDHLLRVRQVHGADVAIHRAAQPLPLQPVAACHADIIAGNDSAVAFAIQTADCVPLLIGDARRGVVAAAHAGWRGTALRVARTAVATLEREFGSRPSDLVAAVGPAIGPCCYQVGVDVRDRFVGAGFTGGEIAHWFTDQRGRLVLDLWTATRDQLVETGVPPEQVYLSGLCTATHSDACCSYRRDGAGAGRMAAVIRSRVVLSPS